MVGRLQYLRGPLPQGDWPDQDLVMTLASSPPNASPGKTLSPEAIRALQEAAARRAQAEAASEGVREIGGPAGEEPTRFGDWERKGLAVDF